MLYALLPVVMFGATGTMDFTAEYFLPPLIIASISIITSTTGYLISRKVWGEHDKRHNLLGMLGVSSNATYFGVPIALALAAGGPVDVLKRVPSIGCGAQGRRLFKRVLDRAEA